MGIHSRDYARQGSTGGGFRFSASGSLWAIKYLLIANGIVFAVDSFLLIPVNDWLSLEMSHRVVSAGADVYEGIPQDGSKVPADVIADTRVEGGTVVYVLDQEGLYVGIRWGQGRQQSSGWVERESVRRNWLGIASVWRYVTYGFCHGHGNMMHILINMYVLWMFGRLVEPICGSREFLAFYLTAIVVSGICFLGVRGASQTDAGVVGASGAVMAVVFLAAMHYPREKVLLMFVIPIEFRWLAVIYAVADTMGFIQGETDVAHIAHLGGAAFGVAYKYYGWQMYGIWSRMRGGIRLPKRRSRTNVKIYQPTTTSTETPRPGKDLDSQVDQILDKINQSGEASLTEKEREILKEASRRYKKQ